MKKIILISTISLFGLASCGPSQPIDKKKYDLEIIYTNGDTLNSSYIGGGDNLFSLKNGDLTTKNFTKTLVSGVRSFRVLSIEKIGKFSKKELESTSCGCWAPELKLVTNDFN